MEVVFGVEVFIVKGCLIVFGVICEDIGEVFEGSMVVYKVVVSDVMKCCVV